MASSFGLIEDNSLPLVSLSFSFKGGSISRWFW